ncbi:MAG: amidase family protein, partial [Gemmatimonadaceae bacterium]
MSDDSLLSGGFDRRRFLGYFSAVGLGGTLLPGVLWAKVAGGEEITPATIACAEEISGLKFTDAQRQQMVDGLKSQETQIQQLRTIALDNAVAPAVHFDPVPPGATLRLPAKHAMVRSRVPARTMPRELDELAFLPVTELSELVRRRKVTATQLTEMYLARIARYDPALKAVITVTRERALRQAREADAEIARGRYRGPLHGIPWGAKDLLAVKGYKTTWGAGPYRE